MKKNRVKKHLYKGSILLLLVAGSFVVLRYTSLQNIRTAIEGFRGYAPAAYITAFSILPIFLFPVPPLALVSGILFGVIQGTLYTLIGAFINTTLMFFLSRYIGREIVEHIIYHKIKGDLQEKLLSEQQSSITLIFFILRLVPLISYNLINYVAGITKIRYGNYMISTIVGIIPGTIVFLNVGDKLLNIQSTEFAVSILLLIGFTILSVLSVSWYFKKH